MMLIVVGALAAKCDTPTEGISGREGIAQFEADPTLLLSARLAVGTRFAATAIARKSEENTAGWTVTSSDESVLSVTEVVPGDDSVSFVVMAAGTGRGDVQIERDGAVIDAITLEVATAVRSVLVDEKLLGVIDARLPERFAMIAEEPIRVLVASGDSCGTDLLDAGASTLVVDPPEAATITAATTIGFDILATTPRSFTVALHTAGVEEDLVYRVDAVSRDDVDEVHAEAVIIDTNTATVTLWGRAFVNDIDVLGLEFDWQGSERVTLNTPRGVAVAATVAIPTEGQTDDRPATVRAEVFGVDATTELLSLSQATLVGQRGTIHQRPEPEVTSTTTSAGCGGGTTCVPALLTVPMLLNVRRRRRLCHA
jgi:hypothetical protein